MRWRCVWYLIFSSYIRVDDCSTLNPKVSLGGCSKRGDLIGMARPGQARLCHEVVRLNEGPAGNASNPRATFPASDLPRMGIDVA